MARLVVFALAVALLATLTPSHNAQARLQQNQITETIVGPKSGRVWKAHRDGVEQGLTWRQPGFDDSAWTDTPMRFYERHGAVVGNGYYGHYFVEEFEITDVHQITELQLGLYYDDAAVMYLNGTEIYRSIRNNLPSLVEVPHNDPIPVGYTVTVGGAEDYYVRIPATSNYCEKGCIDNGATEPVDLSLLVEGTNTFAIMAWTRPKSDLGVDLTIDVVRDLDALPPDQIKLNEVVASNETTLTDEDGDSPDWFELYNPGLDPVSLAGWRVEDTLNVWEFPAVAIPAGGYLAVFASGKNRAPSNGDPLHASFKLSKEGDALRLIDANNLVRDEWPALPRQLTDVAYGRIDNGATLGYLESPTPAAANSGASSALDPVIRPFSHRIFNVGDPVDLSVDAFDPEATSLTYSMPNNQGLTIDSAGVITGTASVVGEFAYTVAVTDANSQSASQLVNFTVMEAPSSTTPLVLNEYNAVAPDRELAAGSDPAFGAELGNGGDWYEFVVVEDLLDLRGWSIQLWDRDRADEMMDRAAYLEFGDDFLLAALPAGTIITISEDRADDLSFDPANDDWTIDLQASVDSPGAMFVAQENFNSTRDDQHVEIRDRDGVLMSPIVGETEHWDQMMGGVNGGEVMNLCIDPVASDQVDPVEDYRDNSVASSYGSPNECEYTDDLGNVVQFSQNLDPLRSTGGVRGDVNCDERVNVVDALLIAQYSVGNRSDHGSCPLSNPATQVNLDQGDFNVESGSDIVDALIISQCEVGIAPEHFCLN